jgi:hypothetical protein
MILPLLFGLASALGHHFFYRHLHGFSDRLRKQDIHPVPSMGLLDRNGIPVSHKDSVRGGHLYSVLSTSVGDYQPKIHATQ